MKKIYVAMSGGVDSSVAAALLKKEYEVTGVFMRGWVPARTPGGREYCDWRDERRDAMRVAAKLEIPFLTFDFSADYKKIVVDKMLSEYRAGRTPNPDIICNKEIKFGLFYNKARELGADLIATGHYVKTNGLRMEANDTNKDQSYFLWAVPKEVLKSCLFPVGDYEKEDVRKLAKKFALPVADKKDSQGVCFIGELDVKDFLRQNLPARAGVVVNEKGEVVGEHDGAHYFTIGERHGFSINQSSAEKKPYYIVGKNLEKNELIVSTDPKTNSHSKSEVELIDTNWLGDEPIVGKKYQYRARYREALADSLIKNIEDGRATISLTTPRSDLAPGQSFVLYNDDICLGGGIIK